MFWVVLGTSLWVLFDAHAIGVKRGLVSGFADMGPWSWFFACLLLWIVAFPLYLAKRGDFKRLNEGMPHTDRQHPPPAPTPPVFDGRTSPMTQSPHPAQPAIAHVVCSLCNESVDATFDFCPKCGAKNYQKSVS